MDEASSEREQRGAQRRSDQEASGEGQRTLSDEVRDFPLPLLGFIDLGESRSPNRASCALTAGSVTYHLQAGPTSPKRQNACARAIITARQPKGRGGQSRPPPRRPLCTRLRRLKKRAHRARLRPRLWAFNGLVPYQVSVTLAWPEPRARKTRPSKGAIIDRWYRDPLDETGHHRCPRIRRITDQQLEGRLSREPMNPADVSRMGGT
jgi:hypothetical protein